jgi:hypothetical protein
MADLDFQRQQIEQEYQKTQYHMGFKAEAPLTDQAQITKKAELAEVGAKRSQVMNESSAEYANLQSDVRIAQAGLVGTPDEARREQLQQAAANERQALLIGQVKGSSVLKAFDERTVLEEQELIQEQTKKRQALASESARTIADIQGEAQDVQLRAAGNTYEADRDEFTRTGQDNVKILREQAAATNDAALKTQLLAQADAQQKANTQEVAAMDAGRKRQEDAGREGATERQKSEREEQKRQRQQVLHEEQLATLQANANASGRGDVGQYEGLREALIQQQMQDSGDSAKLTADRANAAARIREFVAETRNAGAGRIMSAEQYGNSLLASALHDNGAAEALGMAGADLKTLGGGGGLASNLGEVGQKLNSAADKWSHIADQMRNVTILTMGR